MKNRYSLNYNNQLLISSPEQKKPLVVNGYFSVDGHNRLIYWLNEPRVWRRQYSLPPKIVFKGKWQLSPNYDLELILDKTRDQFVRDCLALKGEIISPDRDALVFEIKSLDKRGQSHIQLLKLGGSWQADEYNRLSFMVKKRTSPDSLTLEGAWQINQNQQIIYHYEKTDLKTKTKISRTLTFEGFWQLNSTDKLTYILSRSSQSRFDFRAQIESPNLYPKEGVIKYRLGIGLKEEGRPPVRIISLYGNWKFSRKLGLAFEMDYGKGKIKTIEFGTDISLTEKDKFSFALKNKRGEPLGINITFTHKFLKQLDAETFLRLSKSLKKESTIEAGVRIPF